MASLKGDAILLIGPTASGKTPLGEMVAERGIEGLKCHHFDFGAQLREIASGPGQEGFSGEEVAFIRGVLKEGLLLEDEHFSLARKDIPLLFEKAGSRRKRHCYSQWSPAAQRTGGENA